MAGGENFLAQLKSAVDPLTVFSHYISLKKSGARFRALCPFHSEKTPSFYCSENGMFHCFGCGAGGDVIKFVMMMEKMDFKEAIQMLSARYGIALKFSDPGERKEKDQLLEIMRQAADYFHNLLTTSSIGAHALAYLEERGVSKETIRHFYLGWAPDSWNSLLDHFAKRDVSPALLEKCGLVAPRQNEGYYDRYRSRIIIPIHDIHGNIIAFGGRILGGTGEEAKYVNSPEMLLYSKSHQLFGLYYSKDEIQQKKFAILVEGYFDMMMPYQTGHDNIVASLGTSLTEHQARLLRRYTDRVIIFYDPDTAGKTAVLRALPILLKENFAVSVGRLPEGQDPDKFAREEGYEGFKRLIDHALTYDDLFLRALAEKHDLKSPAGRLAAAEELIALLETVENPFERNQLLNKFSSQFGISSDIVRDLYKHKRKYKGFDSMPANVVEMQEPEKRLLQIQLIDPKIAREISSQMTEEIYTELSCPQIFQKYFELVHESDVQSAAEIIHMLEKQEFLSKLIMEEELPVASQELAEQWLQKILLLRKDRIRKLLVSEIEEARRSANEEKLNELLRQKLSLHK